MTTHQLFKKDFYQRIGGLKKFEGLRVLDLGCGDGEDAVNIAEFAESVVGVDIYKHPKWLKIKNVKFVVSKAEKLPFKDNEFNGLFLKDVLHHVQSIDKTLREIKKVTSKDGKIILVEGNRYNPLFYIHMTKLYGHEHLSQKEFKDTILKYFPNAKFTHFESHFVPFLNSNMFRMLIKVEKMIDKLSFLRPFLSYNAAIIN